MLEPTAQGREVRRTVPPEAPVDQVSFRFCLRAGWTLGPTLERYLRSADAGDQFCGRVVAGLPQLTKDFSALPPHFKNMQPGPEADMIDKGVTQAFPYPRAHTTNGGKHHFQQL